MQILGVALTYTILGWELLSDTKKWVLHTREG